MMKKNLENLKSAANKGQSIIHFSNLKDKLGIYPLTDFDTPAGVYGYILTESSLDKINNFEKMRGNKKKLFENYDFSEFAIERDYIYIAEINPSRNKIIVNVVNGDSVEVYPIFDNLKEILISVYSKSPFLFDSEFEILFNTQIGLEKLPSVIDELSSNSKITTAIGAIWNVTRVFSRNPVAWGRLLYELGISAVFDHGSGLIHDHEPAQAVVFETNKIDVLYHGENKLVYTSEEKIKAIRNFNIISSDIIDRDSNTLSYNWEVKNVPKEMAHVEKIRGKHFLTVESPDIQLLKIEIWSNSDDGNFLKSFCIVFDFKKGNSYIMHQRGIGFKKSEIIVINYKNKRREFNLVSLESLDSNIIGFVDYIPTKKEDVIFLCFELENVLSRSTVLPESQKKILRDNGFDVTQINYRGEIESTVQYMHDPVYGMSFEFELDIREYGSWFVGISLPMGDGLPYTTKRGNMKMRLSGNFLDVSLPNISQIIIQIRDDFYKCFRHTVDKYSERLESFDREKICSLRDDLLYEIEALARFREIVKRYNSPEVMFDLSHYED